jgi:serine phosphatase RsbU (regulator of sigma subunit)
MISRGKRTGRLTLKTNILTNIFGLFRPLYSLFNIPYKIGLNAKITGLVIFFIVAAIASVTYLYTIREMDLKRVEMENQMQRIARNIASIRLLETQDWNLYQDYIEQVPRTIGDIVYIAVYDVQNELKAHALNEDLVDIQDVGALDETARSGIVRQLDRGMVAEESQDDLERVSVDIQYGDVNLGSVTVGFSLIKMREDLTRAVQRNLALLSLYIAVGVTMSAFLSRRLTRPLEKLARAMQNISKGDLDQKVDIETHDEIGDLARAFNLMTQGLKEKRAMERELALAQEIQLTLLPKGPPVIPGYDIAGVYVPSTQVGGDYYDYIQWGDGYWGIAIGDVTGHGTPAALLMSTLQAGLRAQIESGRSLCDLMFRLNSMLCRSTTPETFATLFFGLLDADRGRFLFSNAGHNYPLWVNSKGEMRCLEKGGLLLGVMENVHHEEDEITLSSGDVIVFYTDGLTESVDDQGVMFGEERLEQIIKGENWQRAEDLLKRILGEVEQFSGRATYDDDVTLVVLKVKE